MENLVFTQLSIPEIRNLLRQELEKFFLENTPVIKDTPEQSKVVDLDGLLKARPFIGSRSTIYKKVSDGIIPHAKNGKRLIFDLQVIDEWLLSNRIKTSKEIENEVEVNMRNRKRARNR